VYLINYRSLQAASLLGIFRTGRQLVGTKDGFNKTFYTPGMEKYVHNLPYVTIQVYYNGQRLILLDDYIVVESGGLGTGYDSIILDVAPLIWEKVSADYLVLSP
jgi:hypothetical protein